MAQAVAGRKKYWRVGFDVKALYLIRLMSGLVDIKAIEYGHGVLWFYVVSRDKTRKLFREGLLRGEPVAGFPAESFRQLLVTDLTVCPRRSLIDLS